MTKNGGADGGTGSQGGIGVLVVLGIITAGVTAVEAVWKLGRTIYDDIKGRRGGRSEGGESKDGPS